MYVGCRLKLQFLYDLSIKCSRVAFANKYNQLNIHDIYSYFLSFIVTRETNKEKKKSSPTGTRTQVLSL